MVENNKTEISKSWFVLAQILMVVAGFLFTASTVLYNNSSENFDESIDLLFKTINLNDDYVTYLSELNKTNNDSIDEFKKVFFDQKYLMSQKLIDLSNSKTDLSTIQLILAKRLLLYGVLTCVFSFLSFVKGVFSLKSITESSGDLRIPLIYFFQYLLFLFLSR